jgi:hypothetical protein
VLADPPCDRGSVGPFDARALDELHPVLAGHGELLGGSVAPLERVEGVVVTQAAPFARQSQVPGRGRFPFDGRPRPVLPPRIQTGGRSSRPCGPCSDGCRLTRRQCSWMTWTSTKPKDRVGDSRQAVLDTNIPINL